ncbi:MAG TPA: phosphodiesterase [Spirochaeta sp.]|nr:phosphodiesterase [Spirochaeta sp.]
MMKYFTIAQITDLHVGRTITCPSGEVDLFDQLVKTVKHINNFDPPVDLVAVTGDLVNHGHLEDYNRVKRELDKLNAPYFIVVGNHDQRQTLRRVFHDHPYLAGDGEFIQYAIEDKPIRIIALDTLEPGTHFGLLCKTRLDWLKNKLKQQPDRPTLIFMHHPPFETGMPYPDSLGMHGKKEFGEIIAGCNQIEAIASGHTHRDSVVGWKGTIVYVTPSSSFSYALEFHDVDDLTPLMEPTAYRLLRWDPEVGLVSHLNYTDDYEYGLSEGVPEPPKN